MKTIDDLFENNFTFVYLNESEKREKLENLFENSQKKVTEKWEILNWCYNCKYIYFWSAESWINGLFLIHILVST